MMQTLAGILLPFFGTSAGAGCVFFIKKETSARKRSALTGFAAGIMAASSVWSLILPSIEQSAALGRLCFLPAVFGFFAGVGFMQPLDRIADRFSSPQNAADRAQIRKMIWAVVLHNLPEGTAVGVVFAEAYAGRKENLTAAFAFALGIAIQNFPEGAIVSAPLRTLGNSRGKSFLLGALSGAVEPLAAASAFAAFRVSRALMPYLLSFAAGAMVWVAVSELIPESASNGNKNTGAIAFCIGAAVMMIADVAAR